ncbi:uncharacterized protein [Choristoneura fumiferana]|uniref:uncharacterized protein n=1 Tax=Choristoneura fumiferana TaxID=7141 RepID=UPI003D158A0E
MGSDDDKSAIAANFCRDFIRGCCVRENCRFIHEMPPRGCLKELFRFCHDYQNKGCFRVNCKFSHITVEEEAHFYETGSFPQDPRSMPVCQAYLHGACSNHDCKMIHPLEITNKEPQHMMSVPPPPFNRPPRIMRDEESAPEPKLRRFTYEDNAIENQVLSAPNLCQNCESLDHKVKLLHDNISVLLKKVADLTEKNVQLTSMNEFLLEQAQIRSEQSCVITSRHGTSAPVSLATVSMTPVVSLSGALPTLVPAAATPNLALAPASSRAQLLTPAPQLLTVSTTQQLMGNSGALIVTSAGAQQLMHVSDSGTLMGGGQTVVAVTPAQLTLAPPPQQLVQQSGLGPQLTAPQYATQQSVQQMQQNAQHLVAQQSAQHLAAAQQAAQQSAQHLAAQQSAQHLAAQQSAQHLAAQQSAQQLAQQSAQQLAAQQVPSAQQLVHQTSTQQITISSTSQPMALSNSQNQPLTFPIISQSILPH